MSGDDSLPEVYCGIGCTEEVAGLNRVTDVEAQTIHEFMKSRSHRRHPSHRDRYDESPGSDYVNLIPQEVETEGTFIIRSEKPHPTNR